MKNSKSLPKSSINDLKVKKPSGITTTDMENVFITENLLQSPMYEPITIDNTICTYKFFPYNDFRLELYCNQCKCRRIFAFENSDLAYIDMASIMGPGRPNNVGYILSGIDYFTLYALADCKHELIVTFKKIDENNIMKVGQFPSIYDMDETINNKQFLKELEIEYQKHYKKACSSFSYGFCIGAMTYLRRIFEMILTDTFNDNKENISIPFSDFEKQRMEDKIITLKSFLPNIMQEQGFNTIYTKISNGIHNLSEKECKEMFPILKSGIEEILIERMEHKEKEKRKKELSKHLQNV